MIEIQHLTKRFGPLIAVRDLSLTVRPGEVLGFLGPNGAGKSTTMKMVTGYLAPDEGSFASAVMTSSRTPSPPRRDSAICPKARPPMAT